MEGPRYPFRQRLSMAALHYPSRQGLPTVALHCPSRPLLLTVVLRCRFRQLQPSWTFFEQPGRARGQMLYASFPALMLPSGRTSLVYVTDSEGNAQPVDLVE